MPVSSAGVAIISGFSSGWPASKSPKLDSETERIIRELLRKSPVASRGKLVKLVTMWGVKGLDTQLAEITRGMFATIADVKVSDADRIEAAKQLVEFQPEDEAAVEKLLAVITPRPLPLSQWESLRR